MTELRQFINYVLGLAFIAGMLLAVSSYTVVEGVQYVPEEDTSVSAAGQKKQVASAEVAMGANGRPVWIVATPKYDYDPKLMIVKPRAERLKEAAIRRQQEAAQYVAKQRADKAQRQLAQQRREQRLRAQGGTFAYQPEQRRTFDLFSLLD